MSAFLQISYACLKIPCIELWIGGGDYEIWRWYLAHLKLLHLVSQICYWKQCSPNIFGSVSAQWRKQLAPKRKKQILVIKSQWRQKANIKKKAVFCCQLATSPKCMRTESLIHSACACIWITLPLMMNRNVCLSFLKRHQLFLAQRSGCLLFNLSILLKGAPDGCMLRSMWMQQNSFNTAVFEKVRIAVADDNVCDFAKMFSVVVLCFLTPNRGGCRKTEARHWHQIQFEF